MLNDAAFLPLKNGAAPRPVEDDFQFLKIPDDAGNPAEIAARICGFKRSPDSLWRYCDEAGAALFYIGRWNLEGVTRGDKPGKSFKPLAFMQLPDGRREWTSKHWPAPRPLYGLDELAKRPEAPVVICEGEKSCDAARQLLAKSACLTWPGGTGGVKSADFSPLAGRRVILWPDADGPGHKAMSELAVILAGLKCDLSLVDSEALAALAGC
jgi:putative DNA primase/helicase